MDNILQMLSKEREDSAGLVVMLFNLLEHVDTSRHKPLITIWDFKEPHFTYVSQSFADILGRSIKETIETPFAEMMPPEHIEASMAEYNKNKEKKGVTRIRNFFAPYTHADGHSVGMWWDGVNDSSIGYGGGLVYLYDRYARD